MGDPARRRLAEAGATTLTGKTAEAFIVENGRIAGARLAGGETLRADVVVSALAPEVLLRLLPEEWRTHPAFAPAGTHEWSPIVNLHVWWDRPVMDCEFAAFVDSPAQWVFNRSRIAGEEGPGAAADRVAVGGVGVLANEQRGNCRRRSFPNCGGCFRRRGTPTQRGSSL